jgi:hypothetical protein
MLSFSQAKTGRADALEEHHQLQLEEDDRVGAGRPRSA